MSESGLGSTEKLAGILRGIRSGLSSSKKDTSPSGNTNKFAKIVNSLRSGLSKFKRPTLPKLPTTDYFKSVFSAQKQKQGGSSGSPGKKLFKVVKRLKSGLANVLSAQKAKQGSVDPGKKLVKVVKGLKSGLANLKNKIPTLERPKITKGYLKEAYGAPLQKTASGFRNPFTANSITRQGGLFGGGGIVSILQNSVVNQYLILADLRHNLVWEP